MGDTPRITARPAPNYPLDLDMMDGTPRTPSQEADALLRDYAQLHDDIVHHNVTPQQAQDRAHGLEMRAQRILPQVGPGRNQAVNNARAEFNQFWQAQDIQVPSEARPLSSLAGGAHRASGSHAIRRPREAMQSRMREAVDAMRRTPDFPQAVLQSLTRGTRPSELVRFAAQTSTAEIRRMAESAGASPEEAARIVENIESNAAMSFHAVVRDRVLHQLGHTQRGLRSLLRQPRALDALAHGMLHGADQAHMQRLAQQMFSGETGEQVRDLLNQFATHHDPADRARIQRDLRALLPAALRASIDNVGNLQEQVRSGALSSATDTQLYQLAPGAVTAAAGHVGLTPNRARAMAGLIGGRMPEATSPSILEAGVARHANEVRDEEHLRELTTRFVGWAIAIGGIPFTGGLSLGVSLLRSGMNGVLRYAVDSGRIEQAEAAQAAGLVGQAEVDYRERTRDAHTAASMADVAIRAVLGGAALTSKAAADRAAAAAMERTAAEARSAVPAIVQTAGQAYAERLAAEGGRQLFAQGAENLAKPLIPMAVRQEVGALAAPAAPTDAQRDASASTELGVEELAALAAPPPTGTPRGVAPSAGR